MSTKAVQNKFSNNIDKNTQYLIFGYVREIGIKNQLIPSTVIALCIEFYISKSIIFYIDKISSDHPMKIKVANLDEQKYYNCKLITLYTSDTDSNREGYASNTGFCVANNIELPSFISSNDELKNIHTFDVFICFGIRFTKKL